MSVYINETYNTPVFHAVLKDLDGEELAVGSASIHLQEPGEEEEGYIEFTSEFVPLYPLGTNLEIYRLYGRREVHRFSGQVYLSDTNLIRLIKVQDEPLPSALDVCCADVAFPATVTVPSNEVITVGFFRKKKAKDPDVFPATMTAMTQSQVEVLIESGQEFPEAKKLTLTVSEPPLFQNVVISVRKAFTYGERTSCLCAIESESDAAYTKRMQYLKEHQQSHPCVFSV